MNADGLEDDAPVDVEICKRKLTVRLKGMSVDGIRQISRELEKRMVAISKENTCTADTGKIAILAALDCIAELCQYKRMNADLDRVAGILKAAGHPDDLTMIQWLETTRRISTMLLQNIRPPCADETDPFAGRKPALDDAREPRH
ncbi:MAG: cell division protein ZapA [Elusimicrobia bacterium]|nr:cell division protein ZapA [Elusimicrobiota bacterium]MDE2236829.1 cell division protein ZapA [Elusimicrobiota bacterium]MDE2425388.1 cell division protein ZapA [Elusimicrobiota bacterium]